MTKAATRWPGRRPGGCSGRDVLPRLLLGLLLLAGPEAARSAGPTDPPGGRLRVGDSGFELDVEDQHGDRIVYPLPSERLNPDGSAPVTLVVWADRRGADARTGWTEALRGRYPEQLERETRPGLVVLPVAHLPDVPGLLRGFIVRRYFADRPPTGLDWERTVAEQLGLEPSVPNLAVLAPDGRLVTRLSGPATEDTRRRLFRTLDPLLYPDRSDPESLRRWLDAEPEVPWP